MILNETLADSSPCRATKWSLSIIVFLTKKSLHLKSQFFRSGFERKVCFLAEDFLKKTKKKMHFEVCHRLKYNFVRGSHYAMFFVPLVENCTLMYILIVWLIFPQKEQTWSSLFAQLNKVENAIAGFNNILLDGNKLSNFFCNSNATCLSLVCRFDREMWLKQAFAFTTKRAFFNGNLLI